jgi:carboxymethylenebutenolidase
MTRSGSDRSSTAASSTAATASGRLIRLTAIDGHTLDAYQAMPSGHAVGGIVLIQEIFGITEHIRRVADRFAAAGFRTIAPAMFDRLEPNVVLDYSAVEAGIGYMRRLDWPGALADVRAAIEAMDKGLRVGGVGYCWGGTVVHAAAAELPLDAGVAYYGGGIARMLDRHPKCPMMYHFGDKDRSIPMTDVEKIRAAYPDAVYHVYAGAGHGFNCEDRSSYSEKDAELAFERTVAFLRAHLGT